MRYITHPKHSSGQTVEGLKSLMEINPRRVSKCLEAFIREHMEKLEREGIVLGLSGGLDSAVVASLCSRAIGPERVLALIMPERDSEKESERDALEVADCLKIRSQIINITPYLKSIGAYDLFFLNKLPLSGGLKAGIVKKLCKFYEKCAMETPFSASMLGFRDKKFSSYLRDANAYYRIKHRLRMLLLYMNAERQNRLVVGAANKTEYLIGFFVKHGCDDASDIMPIINLYKTQVRQLADYLNIPKKIIEKPPSPDIIPGIIDEEAIGLSYENLDLVLLALEKKWNDSYIINTLKIKQEKLNRIKNLMKKSEHMRRIYTP